MSNKGEETRQRILREALQTVSTLGFEGLTLGRLAESLGLSKSGLFAHFKSREELQLATLAQAAREFHRDIVEHAQDAPRGLPRLLMIFNRWTSRYPLGGCVLLAGSSEYDDRPGPMREALAKVHSEWRQTLVEVLLQCQQEGHLSSDFEPGQVAFEIFSLAAGGHHDCRLLGSEVAQQRLRLGLERLLLSYKPSVPSLDDVPSRRNATEERRDLSKKSDRSYYFSRSSEGVPGGSGRARYLLDLALRPRRRRNRILSVSQQPKRKLRCPSHGEEIAVYQWDGPGCHVLVSHGWNSSAFELSTLIDSLREVGCAVTAFDHVGHGHSSGQKSSLPCFLRTLKTLHSFCGPVDRAVGHSVGGTALAAARFQLGVQLPLALLAPPADPQTWLEPLTKKMGASVQSLQQMIQLLETVEQEKLDQFLPETTSLQDSGPTLLMVADQDVEVKANECLRFQNGSTTVLRYDLTSADLPGHQKVLQDLQNWARA